MSSAAPDTVHQFLLNSDKVVKDARFLISSLPNVETAAVDRLLRQLHAVVTVMLRIDDQYITQDATHDMVTMVNTLIEPLDDFINQEPLPKNANVPMESPTGRRGRPRYKLDVDRARELHDLGNSWGAVASAMGVDRKTLNNHFEYAGLSTARAPYTDIDDDALDDHVADISLAHPLAGAGIVQGHLNARGIVVPRKRVQDSLQRVDSIGVMLREYNTIRRRVYHVRGSNALWHQDGNEKLKPWGFYVHGCVDGHSRRIIYLVCSNNKRSATVGRCFQIAVHTYGWPSRVRGDFGTENNEIERMMWKRWGHQHRAYLRGRSLHNIRIERLWRDVRKDTLEFFRRIFMYLEEVGLLDMESQSHRIALYLVFRPRIQKSLDETKESWNLHKIRTAGNKTPLAIYELSRERAIREGYWTGDPGDDISEVNESYGVDHGDGVVPPAEDIAGEPNAPRSDKFDSEEDEFHAGIFVNHDAEIRGAHDVLGDFDLEADDGQWGIDIFCEVVMRLMSYE